MLRSSILPFLVLCFRGSFAQWIPRFAYRFRSTMAVFPAAILMTLLSPPYPVWHAIISMCGLSPWIAFPFTLPPMSSLSPLSSSSLVAAAVVVWYTQCGRILPPMLTNNSLAESILVLWPLQLYWTVAPSFPRIPIREFHSFSSNDMLTRLK